MCSRRVTPARVGVNRRGTLDHGHIGHEGENGVHTNLGGKEMRGKVRQQEAEHVVGALVDGLNLSVSFGTKKVWRRGTLDDAALARSVSAR